MFARNLYRYGLLGRFIGVLHAVAQLHGKKLERHCSTRARRRSSAAPSNATIAPLFDYKSIRLLSKSPVSLYALGIPPAQYDELVVVADGDADRRAARARRAARLRFPDQRKLFRLAGLRRAAMTSRIAKPFPPICARDTYEVIRTRTDRVEVHHASLTDFLEDAAGAFACTATCCSTRRTG